MLTQGSIRMLKHTMLFFLLYWIFYEICTYRSKKNSKELKEISFSKG